jgi:hypothetical protein
MPDFYMFMALAGWFFSLGVSMTPLKSTTLGYLLIGLSGITALTGTFLGLKSTRIALVQGQLSQEFYSSPEELGAKVLVLTLLLIPMIAFAWSMRPTIPSSQTNRQIRDRLTGLVTDGINIENQAIQGDGLNAYYRFIVWEQDGVRYLNTLGPMYVLRFNHPRYTVMPPNGISAIAAHTVRITRPRVQVLQDIFSEHPL